MSDRVRMLRNSAARLQGVHAERAIKEIAAAYEAERARAQTAEDALARLREVAVQFEAPLPERYDSPARDALWKALAAAPDDLAEASRREWKAQGMEEAAAILTRHDWRGAAQDVREAATKTRGEK